VDDAQLRLVSRYLESVAREEVQRQADTDAGERHEDDTGEEQVPESAGVFVSCSHWVGLAR
jgi:hypothetical protein